MEARYKLFNFRPAVVISAGLILGIILAYLCAFVSAVVFACLSILVGLLLLATIIYFVKKKQAFNYIFSLVLLLFFLLGIGLVCLKLFIPSNSGGLDLFYNIKQKLLLNFKKFMPDVYGLNYAVLTGDTSFIDSTVIERYRNVGIAHLFAVSGLHIGLMYGVLAITLKLFKVDKKLSLLLEFVILLLYVAFCGFSPSSLRAFIIVIVREVALTFGEKPDKLTNVALSLIVVLIINPLDLFSVGFLLSYSVYLGLILLAKPFANYMCRFLPKFLANILSPCIIAQVVSIPILIDAFGYVSLFSFLFNMLLLPIISIVYPFILLSGVLVIFEDAFIFAIVPNITFTFLNWVLSFANTKLFLIGGIFFSYSAIFYYLYLFSFAGIMNINGKKLHLLQAALFLLFIVAFFIVNLPFFCKMILK